MCYIQEWTWTQCGHRWQGHLLCEDAQRRQPPTYCETAHWVQLPLQVPHESQLAPGKSGLCPDLARHPERAAPTVKPLNFPPGQGVVRTYEPSVPPATYGQVRPNGQNGQNGQANQGNLCGGARSSNGTRR